ncbi:hypothetical protein NFI96_028567, partial [Prochilodus magdalenae]
RRWWSGVVPYKKCVVYHIPKNMVPVATTEQEGFKRLLRCASKTCTNSLSSFELWTVNLWAVAVKLSFCHCAFSRAIISWEFCIGVSLLSQVRPSQLQWRCLPVICCSTSAPSNDITVQYRHGRPVLALPLPSRQEKCLFFLRPMLTTVGDLIQDIQKEDSGVLSASILTPDGVRVASGTPMDTLLNKDFQLHINAVVYNVHSVQTEPLTSERVSNIEDLKNAVHMLHTAVHLPEHHLMKEKELKQKLDILKQELMPLEEVMF